MSAEGRVEHQKLNETTALLLFGWVFGVQLDSLEKNLATLVGITFTQKSVNNICTIRVYIYIYTLIVHIFVTANYRDAFMFFAFFLGGGVKIWKSKNYNLSWRFNDFLNFRWTNYRDGFMIFWMFNATNYRDVFLQYSFFFFLFFIFFFFFFFFSFS